MSNERIDIESMEARMRLWAIGDVSDEDLALELDYIVPELKRMYESEDRLLELLQVIEYKYDVPVKQIAAVMSI